jgi:hypothetical protein
MASRDPKPDLIKPLRLDPEFSARPEPTQRTRRDVGPFCRATTGHVVWRGVPSRFQVRTPSPDAQAYHKTKSPPWVRKRKARAKAQLQKASRKLNRA